MNWKYQLYGVSKKLEFVNMYLGHGGEFFKPGTAEPSINNAQGVATLNMLKKLADSWEKYGSGLVTFHGQTGNIMFIGSTTETSRFISY